MIIRNATETDFNKLVEFNKSIYPECKVNYSDILKFWFSRSNNNIKQSIIIDDEENSSIKGQILLSAMDYFYKRNIYKSVWLFNLIVEESLRKSAWGLDLLLEVHEQNKTSCSTGAGENALPLHKMLGNNLIGEIRKYVGIVNPLYFFTSFKRGIIHTSKFPNNVKIKGTVFKKISNEILPSLYKPYNQNLFEPSRDIDYLKWRFYGGIHDYAFFKAQDSNDYFVLRTIIVKGITIMLLADYRCNTLLKEPFDNICKAACKITRKLLLPVLFTGSTLSIIDTVLEHHHFKSVGRPRPVLSTIKFDDREEDIKMRNFCLITLADSDGETNY